MRNEKRKKPLLKFNFDKSYLLPIFLILFFGVEAWSAIKTEIWGIKSYLPMIVKTLVLISIFCYFLFYDRKKFLMLSVLLVVFIIGQLAINPTFNFSAIGSFSKYLFFLLIPALVLDKNNSAQADKSFAIFEGIVFINSVVVILSYVFGWDVFRSYEDRFGYVGLLIASATGTYFYCVALAYYLLKYNIKAFRKFEFYLIAVSIILLGTKSALLYLILSLGAIAFSQLKDLKKKIITILIFFIIGAFSLYFFLQSSISKKITEEYGLITSILSYRDIHFTNQTLPYIEENWNVINYLFGGLTIMSKRPQMEYFDLLLFFGILGSSYYLYLVYKFYKLKNLSFGSLPFFLILFLFAAAFISGNFFYNGSTSIYFVVLILVALEVSKKKDAISNNSID